MTLNLVVFRYEDDSREDPSEAEEASPHGGDPQRTLARQQDSPCLRLHCDPWRNLSAIRVLQGASSRPLRSLNVCDVSQNVPTPSKPEHCVGKVLPPRRKGWQFAYFVIERAPTLASWLSEAGGRLDSAQAARQQRAGATLNTSATEPLCSISQVLTRAGVPVNKTP